MRMIRRTKYVNLMLTGLGVLATSLSAYALEECDAIPIYQVQGSGYSSPFVLKGQYESAADIQIKGVVTAKLSSLGKGFFIQEQEGDGQSDTSDGLFVYTGKKSLAGIKEGDLLCVSGKVKEHYGMTQIDMSPNSAHYHVLGHYGVTPATDLMIEDNESLPAAMERYEGMKVKLIPQSDMVLSRNFSFNFDDFRPNLTLSHHSLLMQPTQLHHPLTPEAMALAKTNQENRLVVDSEPKSKHSKIPYFPDFNADDGYLRLGDNLNNLEGVISYDHGVYRLIPINTISKADIVHNIDRVTAPSRQDSSDLRIASFNVLNYFNEIDSGAKNPLGTNRGAKEINDFKLQQTKIVNAITEIDADIIGLMELENNGFADDSAINNLTNAINAQFKDPQQAYKFVRIADKDMVDSRFFGRDAITVGLLYRPAMVELASTALVIKTPEQHVPANTETRLNLKTNEQEAYPASKGAYQRWSLGQTFTLKNGGHPLTVVVNHLKSKGSDCFEDWKNFEGRKENLPADLQGHCAEFRISAVQTIAEALEPIKGDVLLIGDMNSYAKEDPIWILTDYIADGHNRVLKTASYTTIDGKPLASAGSVITKGYGYHNLSELPQVKALHPDEKVFSYSYANALGSLDHALGNESLIKKVVNVSDWHINSTESNQFEYGHKYGNQLHKSENAYSSTDHDPVIIDLNYNLPKAVSDTQTKSKDSGGSLGLWSILLLGGLGWLRNTYKH